MRGCSLIPDAGCRNETGSHWGFGLNTPGKPQPQESPHAASNQLFHNQYSGGCTPTGKKKKKPPFPPPALRKKKTRPPPPHPRRIKPPPLIHRPHRLHTPQTH